VWRAAHAISGLIRICVRSGKRKSTLGKGGGENAGQAQSSGTRSAYRYLRRNGFLRLIYAEREGEKVEAGATVRGRRLPSGFCAKGAGI